jgi:DNA topoisomerase-2
MADSDDSLLEMLLGGGDIPAPKAKAPSVKAVPVKAVPVKAASAKAASAKAPSAKAGSAKAVAAPAETVELTSEEAGEKFKLTSMKDAVKTKGMWAGVLKPVIIPDLTGAKYVPAPAAESVVASDDEGSGESAASAPAAAEKLVLVDIVRAHTPALLKIMDEIIVNATDHAKEHEKIAPTKRVTRIDITFDPTDGRVRVENDGPGVPVAVHAAATAEKGRPVYVPEVAFGMFLAGTNAKKDATNVKGGTNGLGAKLANAHSEFFVIETCDAVAQRHYRQVFRQRMDVTEAPEVAPSKARPFTRVEFVPAYAELGYKMTPSDGAEHPRLAPADASDLDAWLRLRAAQAAAYIGEKVAVTYNGEPCKTTSAAKLAALLLTPLGEEAAGAVILPATAKAAADPYKAHPWSIAVIVLPAGKKAARRVAAQSMAIVNGVLCRGSHVSHIRTQLSAAVDARVAAATGKARAKPGAAAAAVLAAKKGAAKKAVAPEEKKMTMAETLSGVQLVICAAIPGIDWSSQNKNELPIEKAILDNYVLTATFLKEASSIIAERILAAQGGKTGRVIHDKYTKARHAGRAATKQHTFLAAAEGDSAITLLRAGLTQTRDAVPPGGPSLDWFGIISLQGVIVNAAREVKELETTSGETIHVRSAKLQNNKRLLTVADAFGLRYDRTYATPEERATLNYGQLLLCVDQDEDGTGKIGPLVLVWIYLFWPALLETGRVGRFMTPLVRAYPKRGGAPAEFYYAAEFEHWLAAEPGREDTHRIKYYKGLAAHDEDEVKMMFKADVFRSSIYTYTVDDGARELFAMYYGKDSAARKELLATPVQYLTFAEAAELHRTRRIPVGRVQLNIDAKAYKIGAIRRQLPGILDGLNPARRKILMGAIMRFSNEAAAKELKIFQLGGYVADKCFYHHGDASLNSTIIHMAQKFEGARAYPYLIGVGQFGSRHGDDAGSARYIGVKLSPLARATFPPADRWHLRYVFEDGERAEPETFVPVLPMAVLESYEIVSEGWMHDGWGRDYAAVLAVVDAYIAGDPEVVAAAARLAAHEPGGLDAAAAVARRFPLPVSMRGRASEVREYRGATWSFGLYEWDAAARQVTVTELPIGVPTARYLKTLVAPGRAGAPNPRDEFIEGIEDRSSEKQVRLEIKLREGAFDQILEQFGSEDIDPLEDALMLRAKLAPHLNYYSERGVLEFGAEYMAALLYWAPHRRDLYVARLGREQIRLELSLVQERATQRYCAEAAADEQAGRVNVAKLADDAEAERRLRAAGYPPLNAALLHRPEYTPNDELRARVVAPTAGYAYLLDLADRDKTAAAVAKRNKRIASLEADLAQVQARIAERPTPCASIWREEIAEFERVVAEGIASDWTFKKKAEK